MPLSDSRYFFASEYGISRRESGLKPSDMIFRADFLRYAERNPSLQSRSVSSGAAAMSENEGSACLPPPAGCPSSSDRRRTHCFICIILLLDEQIKHIIASAGDCLNILSVGQIFKALRMFASPVFSRAIRMGA